MHFPAVGRVPDLDGAGVFGDDASGIRAQYPVCSPAAAQGSVHDERLLTDRGEPQSTGGISRQPTVVARIGKPAWLPVGTDFVRQFDAGVRVPHVPGIIGLMSKFLTIGAPDQ